MLCSFELRTFSSTQDVSSVQLCVVCRSLLISSRSSRARAPASVEVKSSTHSTLDSMLTPCLALEAGLWT